MQMASQDTTYKQMYGKWSGRRPLIWDASFLFAATFQRKLETLQI